MTKKGQVSVEYLIIIGFVTFVILTILGTAYIYAGTIKDKIKVNQIGLYAEKITSSAETLFYSGEPAKSTISTYLPEGVQNIEIQLDKIIITFSTSSGTNIRIFESKVPIEGTLSKGHGTHTIHFQAQEDRVMIS